MKKLKLNQAKLDALPPGERAEVEAMLAELAALSDSNPLQFFEPYPKQARFLAARNLIKAFFGGNGAGKTVVGIVWDLIQCVDRECLPEHLRQYKRWDGPVFGRICAPKMGVIEGVILEKIRELCPKDQLRGGSFDKAYSKQDRKLWFKNGSWILFNTYDQDRDAHAGVELHWVHFDEEPYGEHGKGLYTENLNRLRRFMPDAQVIFTMTPLFEMSWSFDEIYERRDDDQVFCVVASMRDNPHIDSEAQIAALGHLSEAEREAIIDGHFVAFSGKVIGNWTEERNEVDPVSPEHIRGQDIFVGIDPGIARGGVIWAAFDRDNDMLVFDELYPSGVVISGEDGLGSQIKAKNRAWGIPEDDVTYIIDPSARNRSLVNAESVESALERESIYCIHGQNSRIAGVLELQARAEQGRLKVAKNCTNMLWERLRWLVAEDEESSKSKGLGEDTFKTKGPDHLWDPARYVALERAYGDHDVPADPRKEKVPWGTAPAWDGDDDVQPVEIGPLGPGT